MAKGENTNALSHFCVSLCSRENSMQTLLWAKEEHKKQTNKCRGGNHNLSSAVFSGCRLISYSHPSKESGISCHMQTCFATSFDLPELQDFRQKTKAEEANSHRAVTHAVFPRLSSRFQETAVGNVLVRES